MKRPKKCECGGKFVTETLHDDWEGVLTCKKCRKKNYLPKSPYFKDVTASRKTFTQEIELADHEILLVFTSDWDAEAFYNWFIGGEGSKLFQKHLDKNSN